MADNENRSNNKRKLNKYEDDINLLDKNITTNTKKLKKLSDDIKIINSNIKKLDKNVNKNQHINTNILEIEDNIDFLNERFEKLEEELSNINSNISIINKNTTKNKNEEKYQDEIINNEHSDEQDNEEYEEEEYEEDEEDEEDDEDEDEDEKELELMEKEIIKGYIKLSNPLLYCEDKLKEQGKTDSKIKKDLEIIDEFINITKDNDNSMEVFDYFMSLSNTEKNKYIKKIIKLKKKDDNIPVYFKIINSNLNEDTKFSLLKKFKSLTNESTSEYHKFNNWINSLFEIPWDKYSNIGITNNDGPDKITNFLKKCRNKMDTVIYGQYNTKDHIIQIITKMISNPSKSGNVFAIYGPAGTGKTSIIKEGMSKALGIPFTFISLGGATDSNYLTGHDYTYEGSKYGRIVESLKLSKTMNPIFYFDELDKVSQTYRGEEIINLLIHLTDPSQNTLFEDKYFSSIPIDLSKAIFVFSFNDINLVNKILLDRMEVIYVNGFTLEEKIIISKKFLLPDLYNNYNIKSNDIIFSDENLNYIINYNNCNTQEKGVRNIRRRFENIISKLNILLLTKNNINNIHNKLESMKNFNNLSFPLNITKEIIDTLINDTNHNDKPPFGMYS